MKDKIKRIICKEVSSIFANEPIKIDDIIDCFINTVLYSLEDASAKLDGIETRFFTSIIDLFGPDKEKRNSAFAEFVKFEPYFRKLLYLTNKSALSTIEAGKKGLSPLIKQLKLNPENKDIFSKTPESLYGENHYIEHLCRAYHLRNKESHHCEDFNMVELAHNIQSVLVVYLYSTIVNYKQLIKRIDIIGLNSYLEDEIDLFKQLQKTHIDINGVETFKEIDLFANEIIDIDESLENQLPRRGTIDSLRNVIPEKQMIILGEVGMGKSTTIQYLHYRDAEACLADNSKAIPVYIELKNLIRDINLLDKIITKLGFKQELTIEFLKKGRFIIFLDGLNEIGKDIKTDIFKQIDSLTTDYPLNKIILTSRPLSYQREFDNLTIKRQIPVFLLQTMQDSQIEEFLDKNGKDVKELILKEINGNPKLKEMIVTPLILSMLINVVRKTQKIPSNKVLIVKSFMLNILNREKRVEEIDVELYHILLCNLAFKSRQLSGANSGMSQNLYVIPLLKELTDTLGVQSLNIWDFLKKTRDLHILTKEKEQYSFTHELYQEYYAAEYLFDKYSIINSNNIAEFIKDPNWEEVIKLYSGLFDKAIHRITFIKAIVNEDPFLAAKCEKLSFESNVELAEHIINVSKHYVNADSNPLLKINSVLALIEYNQYEFIIEFIKNQKGPNIPMIKNIVYSVLSGNIDNVEIWTIIKVFVEANSEFYISDINRFISESKTKIHYNNQIVNEIVEIIIKDELKFHQVVAFLKLIEEHISCSPSEMHKLYVIKSIPLVYRIDNILYFIELFKLDIKVNDIIKKIIDNDEITSLYMLLSLIKNLNKNEQTELVTALFQTNKNPRVAAALILMHKYKLNKEFNLYLYHNQMIKKVYYECTRRIENKTLELDKYNQTIMIIGQKIDFEKHRRNLQIHMGKIIKFKVYTELPYHYLLNVNDMQNTKILLPKAEAEVDKLQKKNNQGTIIYIDKKRNRAYVSMKQQVKSPSEVNFNKDYQYIIRQDDFFDCKIGLLDGKYKVNPIKLGKKLIKVKISQNPEQIQIEKKYQALVKRVTDYDIIEVELIESSNTLNESI